MLWPVRPDTWKESARPAQLAFAAVAKAIARFEPVTVGVPSSQLQSARPLLDATGVGIAVIEQDDAWIRDTGPLFVVGGTRCESSERRRGMRNVRGVDWSFNAWGGEFGGCFSNWDKDDAIASTVLGLVGADRYKANMVLEVQYCCSGMHLRRPFVRGISICVAELSREVRRQLIFLRVLFVKRR